jgi:hypothetical protein
LTQNPSDEDDPLSLLQLQKMKQKASGLVWLCGFALITPEII